MAIADATAPYEFMSPSLLAKQPLTAPERAAKPDSAWNTVYSHLESRMGMLRSWRFSWWAHWGRLAEFFLPRRYHWLVVANRMSRGSSINDQIIDSTGLLAVRTCSSGMWTGMTNPSRRWVKLGIGLSGFNADAEGKEWLEDSEEALADVLEQSNFYSVMAQMFQDLTVFGTAPVIVYEDYDTVIRCYIPCAGEYYLACGSRLDVDTLYREFTLTVIQIVEMFTIDACPQQVVSMWNQGGASLDTEMVVAHAIEPNFALSERGRKRGDDQVFVVPGIFSFREVYWLKGIKTDKPLSKKGFHSKPFGAFRWAEVSNEPYGRSPCMDALGDTKQVQQETRRKAEFIEKGVRPPMGASPEMKNEPSSIIPGMITYVNTEGGKKGFFPLFEVNPAWIGPLAEDIKEVSSRIEKCLFVDLFMAITRMEGVQPRNELELSQRNLERLQGLGPVVDLVKGEMGVIIPRILNIMQRRGVLKPVPKSLTGVPLKLEYISMMEMAQKASKAVSMKDMFGTAGALSSAAQSAGVPNPIRVVNWDESMRDYGEMVDFPTKDVFTAKEVLQHDQARAQATAASQAPQQAMAAVQAAKTLSETQLPGGNSALGAMVGQQGAPGAPGA